MHIKSVKLESFLSYDSLDMGSVELDQGCNLILGKNGTGKSNFIQGVIFALSDRFKNLSKQEKRKFLHEGVSQATNTQS